MRTLLLRSRPDAAVARNGPETPLARRRSGRLLVYENEGLFARAAALSAYWEAAAHRLRGAPHVADIRNLGLVAGFDIAPRAGAPAGQRAMDVFRRCFADGLLIRPSGDTLALSPPLIVSEGQIDEIFDRLADALRLTP